MSKTQALLEVSQAQEAAFEAFDAGLASPTFAVTASESALQPAPVWRRAPKLQPTGTQPTR